MVEAPLTLVAHSPDVTARLAAALGQRLNAGDTLLLSGPVGAGKTHFCRALIRSLLRHDEAIPSPTFTLVQTYETTRGDIWHADLYRLSDAGEVTELGLDEAFETAICLVEWPDRLGNGIPTAALSVTLEPVGKLDDTRRITFNWSDPKWADRLEAISDD